MIITTFLFFGTFFSFTAEITFWNRKGGCYGRSQEAERGNARKNREIRIDGCSLQGNHQGRSRHGGKAIPAKHETPGFSKDRQRKNSDDYRARRALGAPAEKRLRDELHRVQGCFLGLERLADNFFELRLLDRVVSRTGFYRPLDCLDNFLGHAMNIGSLAEPRTKM